MEPADDIATIGALISAINKAWTDGHPEALAQYFHDRMVIVAPGFRQRVEGSEACVRSYADFVGRTTIKGYSEEEAVIDLWGDTAVASYRFALAWEMDGQPYYEAGRDLFVLRRESGRWLVVWRTVLPAADKRAPVG
jgi:ketosteroid isomerase-like protein